MYDYPRSLSITSVFSVVTPALILVFTILGVGGSKSLQKTGQTAWCVFLELVKSTRQLPHALNAGQNCVVFDPLQKV